MIEGKEMNMDINQSRGRVKTNEQRLGLMKWNMNLWIKSVPFTSPATRDEYGRMNKSFANSLVLTHIALSLS